MTGVDHPDVFHRLPVRTMPLPLPLPLPLPENQRHEALPAAGSVARRLECGWDGPTRPADNPAAPRGRLQSWQPQSRPVPACRALRRTA
ncbi:hypothetical protein NKH18_44935 [Streptomyces sp. M10(2022)]